MRRGIATPLTVALSVFLGFCVYLQIWGLPTQARAVAGIFRQVEPIVGPSILVALAFIALSIMGYATPAVMLGLLAGGLLALCAASALGLFLAVRR